MQDKIRFKKGSNVQVKVRVEVDEHVERLVPCAHFPREDGEKKQVVARCSEP